MAAASALPLKRYAEFGGRSTRTELLSFYLLTSIVTFLMMQIVRGTASEPAKPWVEGGIFLFFLMPTISLSVRRLHDWGRSGWWLLTGSPFAAAVIWEYIAYPRPFTLHVQSHLPWWAVIPVVLAVLALWILLLWDDDVDTNLYGPNPRGWTPQEEPA